MRRLFFISLIPAIGMAIWRNGRSQIVKNNLNRLSLWGFKTLPVCYKSEKANSNMLIGPFTLIMKKILF